MPEEADYLEALPDDVLATLEARDRALDALGSSAGGLEFVVENLRKWVPGDTVRVAFLSGSTELHRDIAEVAATINDHCNLTLDFGYDEETDTYRSWSLDDTDYAAEIRVSFDQKGYFSLVGTDSVAPNVGAPFGSVGGRPGQRSLNLGGFEVQRPRTWRGTVIHEFLHAIGFHHEHVNLRGPCQQAFRFEDDAGYLPTRSPRGIYIADSQGRRPGIYTFLSGFPNFWPKVKVDHNLRPSGASVTEGTFDRSSVMLYRFPELFYRTPNSGCAPDGDGQSLSEGDVAGLQLLYPFDDDAAGKVWTAKETTMARMAAALEEAAPPAADVALEGAAGLAEADVSHPLQGAHATLKRQLEENGR